MPASPISESALGSPSNATAQALKLVFASIDIQTDILMAVKHEHETACETHKGEDQGPQNALRDTVMPGISDTAMPGIRDTVMPGIRDTVMPGIRDTVIPEKQAHGPGWARARDSVDRVERAVGDSLAQEDDDITRVTARIGTRGLIAEDFDDDEKRASGAKLAGKDDLTRSASWKSLRRGRERGAEDDVFAEAVVNAEAVSGERITRGRHTTGTCLDAHK